MTFKFRKGDILEFAPNPRFPDKLVRAEYIYKREDRNGRNQGWIETQDQDGKFRAVRPSRCKKVRGWNG